MKKVIFILCLILTNINSSLAGYNDNMVGKVTAVMTYTSGLVLFRLHNQPSTHPTCNKSYFAIATDVKDVATNRMLSRLLTAHTTQTPVNIGFDNNANCGNGYIRVYRVG
jgi:hypothetical protein